MKIHGRYPKNWMSGGLVWICLLICLVHRVQAFEIVAVSTGASERIISFQSTTDMVYTLQYADSPGPGGWAPVSSVSPVWGKDRPISLTDPAVVFPRFYSVHALSAFRLSSLDLMDSNVTSQILQLQAFGYMGGTLLVSGGVAVGGNVVVPSGSLMPDLSALNIPASVTVTLSGFQTNDVLQVILTETSSSIPATISGVLESVGVGGVSSALSLSITSTSASPALLVNSSGSFTSDGTLNLRVGSVSNNGLLEASGTLSLSIPMNLNVTGMGRMGGVFGTTLMSQSGAVNVVQGSVTGLVTGSGALGISLCVRSDMVIGNLTAEEGSMLLMTETGSIRVAAGSHLSAAKGVLTIQDNDLTTGVIRVGNGSILYAGGGSLVLAVGTPVLTPGVQPANFNPTLMGGGQIYYGLIPIVSNPPLNTGTADGGNLVFSVSGASLPGAITLDGGVSLTVEQAP